jgi:hypothetical protein
VTFIRVAAVEDGAFDLDPAEVALVVGGNVIGGRVSPRLGDAESEFGGAGHEAQLRPFASGFGLADALSWAFHFGTVSGFDAALSASRFRL